MPGAYKNLSGHIITFFNKNLTGHIIAYYSNLTGHIRAWVN